MKKLCPPKLSSVIGFTLIELLVVMTIIGILFGIGVAQYTQFNRRQVLEQAAQELKNNLRWAQTKATNGEKPFGCTVLDGYGVSFFSGGSNPDTYEIRAVCGGIEQGETKTFSLPSVIKFNPLPSPSSLLFKVLAQGTDLNSDLTINLVFTGTSLQKSVGVSKNGKIE